MSCIEFLETDWTPLPGGKQLAARLRFPVDANRNPAPFVLKYLPYHRLNNTGLRDEAMHLYFAEAGYTSIGADIRGSGDSKGVTEDEYSEDETRDGLDIIAWVAEQRWCDGNVGTFEKGWGAYNLFQVAAKRPPALKAFVSIMSCNDHWRADIYFLLAGLRGIISGWVRICRP